MTQREQDEIHRIRERLVDAIRDLDAGLPANARIVLTGIIRGPLAVLDPPLGD